MGLFKRSKNNKKSVLGQVLSLIPAHLLKKEINRHKSDKGCSKYMTYDQLVALTFGQLSHCYSLADISIGLSVSETCLQDLGLKQSPAKSTMSDGNKNRSYLVFEGLYYKLINYFGNTLKANHQSNIIEEIQNKNIKLIDSTSIALCLSMFDWAKFRTAKGAVKIHTVWDDDLGLPDLINITEGAIHDSKGLVSNVFKKGTIIVEDRAYFDFALMKSRIEANNVFVTRIKDNTKFKTISELDLPDLKDEDILKDEIIMLNSPTAEKTGISAVKLRLVSVYKADENKVINIISNQLDWTARTIADLYKKRWDIELFFKTMKQNLQIKTFVGTSENAVKSQIFIALITYLLLELIRRTQGQTKTAFSNFFNKIRICLFHYLTLEYLCKNLTPVVKKLSKPPENKLFEEDKFQAQLKIKLKFG